LNFSKNYEWFEKPYQKLEKVFHQVSKHLEVGQKNLAAPRFSTHFSGFGYPDETLFLVFDILHQNYTEKRVKKTLWSGYFWTKLKVLELPNY